MINPNKSYKAKIDGVVIKIDPLTSYIPYVYIKADNGQLFEGSLKESHTQWKHIKVGDKVGFTARFSITSDKFMLDTLIRRRK